MSHGTDGQYAVYDETLFKARKQHECGACEQPIRKGDNYTRVFTLFDGCTDTVKRCARCQTLHMHLREKCNGPKRFHDRLWPAERLDCGENYRENWGEEPPMPIQELAFLLPGEQPGRLIGGGK